MRKTGLQRTRDCLCTVGYHSMVVKLTKMGWTFFLLPDTFLYVSREFTHSILTKPQEISMFWNISIGQLSQWISRTFLLVWFVWSLINGWCLQSPLQLSSSLHSCPSNLHKNPAPWGWWFFNIFSRWRYWAMRSLGDMSKVTGAGTDLLPSVRSFLPPQQ